LSNQVGKLLVLLVLGGPMPHAMVPAAAAIWRDWVGFAGAHDDQDLRLTKE